jgi:adenylosuccinate synthase
MADGKVLFQPVFDEAMRQAELLKPMMADVSRELNEAHLNGANLLFEGAQGTLLDVDHGTYPYVTSSNCVAGNAAAGAGIGPGLLHYILGITKAYCTRVGGGPFPTELQWQVPGTPGYHMSTVGAETGVTTGRSRRCGWFDAALLKRSAQVNGLSGLCITKLDVLDGLSELLLCTGYELDGELVDILPMGADDIERCKPIYETIAGWSDSTVGVTRFEKLPTNARLYLQRIEQVTGVPIHMVSTGPDREQTILLRHPYLLD